MPQLKQLYEQGSFAEAVALCEKEMTTNPSTNTQFNLALSYYHLAFQLGDNEQKSALESSESVFKNLIVSYENEANSTAQKHHNLFDVCMYLVEIYYALHQLEETKQYIAAAFGYNPYNYEANYRLANLALALNELTLCGEIASQYFAFTSLNGDLDQGELMQEIYDLYALSLTFNNSAYTRVHSHQEKIDEMIGFLAKYPNSILLQGAMGNLFYYEGDYESALTYFEKTLGHSTSVTNWYARYIVAHIWQVGTAPKNLPEITQTDAVNVYSGASTLLIDSESFENTPVYDAIFQYREMMLEKSYHLFEDFFNQGKGSSFCFNEHWFAMCCNDYGIVLRDKGEKQKALNIHKIGFHYSVFPAQLINALRCANDLKNATEISEIYQWYDDKYGVSTDSIGAVYYFEAKIYLIDALKYSESDLLLRKQVILDFLAEIEANQYTFYEAHSNTNNTFFDESIADLKAQLVAIDANMNVSPENSFATQEALKTAKENPNNYGNWYVLFQMQHTQGLFEDCIHSANEYERSAYEMSVTVAENEKFTLHYRKGSALVRLEKAAEGLPLLLDAEQIDPTHYWTQHDLALAYLALNQTEKALKYLDYCINYYKKENLRWDNQIAILSRKAIAMMNEKGNKKWIVKLANFILENVPNDIEIKELKKKNTNIFGF
jgi:tetratricopeptide (TPR) repeat protein